MADLLQLRNTTRGTAVATQVVAADSFWARFMGLMGRRSLAPQEGLWLPGTNNIHMFFMRFAIDAVFLDADRRVVRLFPHLPPWSATPRVKGARSVLELPAGAGEASGTLPGDLLEFDEA